jgi:hypothetical protein
VLQVLSRGVVCLGIGKHRAWVGSESTYGFLRGEQSHQQKSALGLLCIAGAEGFQTAVPSLMV